MPITWYLEDRRLQPGAKYGMEEWGTKRRLTIRDMGVDDDGIYLCEMADGGRSIAEVTVKGKYLFQELSLYLYWFWICCLA